MIFSMDSNIATLVGVNGAIMLDNINFWVKTNEANHRNFYDGHYWTYNSIKAFAKLFPFWTERTVRYILDKLEADGYILSGCYNEDKMNHTKWYTLSDQGEHLFKNWKPKQKPHDKSVSKDLPKCENGVAANDFPTNYTDIKHTDIKQGDARAKDAPAAHPSSRRPSRITCPFDNPPPELAKAWDGFVEMRKSGKSPFTQRAADLTAKKLEKLAPGNDAMKADILDQSVQRGWQGVFPLKTDEPYRGGRKRGGEQSVKEMYEEGIEIMKRSGML